MTSPLGTAIAAAAALMAATPSFAQTLEPAFPPEGKVATLFADPRLVWVDAMWIDDHGGLLLPAAQLNRTAGLNGGTDAVEQPITLYRYHIGQQGVRR